MTMNNQTLKQALIAVFIGVAISFINEVAHALVVWLQNVPTEGIGSTAGVVAYYVQKARDIV